MSPSSSAVAEISSAAPVKVPALAVETSRRGCHGCVSVRSPARSCAWLAGCRRQSARHRASGRRAQVFRRGHGRCWSSSDRSDSCCLWASGRSGELSGCDAGGLSFVLFRWAVRQRRARLVAECRVHHRQDRRSS